MMTCNCCRWVVEHNATGVCLSCQVGGGSSFLRSRKKELEDAIEEGKIQESNQREHPGDGQVRSSAETSHRGRIKRIQKNQKDQKELDQKD